MGEFNLDALQVTVYGLGSVGLLTVTLVLVNWLKRLLQVEGQSVRWLTTGVAAYAVGMLAATAYYPTVGLVMGLVFLVALVATTADAYHHSGKREG